VCELDLAVDGVEGLTDQNHIGGALGTLRLASCAGVNAEDSVLDLGCGIGGPLRLLAEVYRCRGHGVDANAARIEDAINLTTDTGLEKLLSFEHADLLERTPRASWSVVWAQNSWIHIDEPAKLASVAAASLRPAGRLAFEDVVLLRTPGAGVEERALAELSDVWRSTFSTLETWCRGFADSGFKVTKSQGDTEILLRDCAAMLARAKDEPRSYPAHEIVGWQRAFELCQAGVIGYSRVVATL